VAPRNGFTLTELAIVLLIVALLISGLLMPLSAQVDLRNASDTAKTLAEIREALVGYASSHPDPIGRPYLPCPDKTTVVGAVGTPNDGQEDRESSGLCSTREGNIPWVTLGISPQVDAWNNRFRYRVELGFSNDTAGFTLASTGSLRVCALANCSITIGTGLPAIILSHGRNGAGAINSLSTLNAAPTGADELQNTDGDNIYVSHTPTPVGSLGGEFDDIVVWLPTSILFSRMIAAGRLP